METATENGKTSLRELVDALLVSLRLALLEEVKKTGAINYAINKTTDESGTIVSVKIQSKELDIELLEEEEDVNEASEDIMDSDLIESLEDVEEEEWE